MGEGLATMSWQLRENSAVTEAGLEMGSDSKAGSANAFFARTRVADSNPCPCGGGLYGKCCGPLHRGEREAVTAAELMAARYSAYSAHEADYIWRTWHPRYRPEIINVDDGVKWEGLTIIDTVDGGEDDREGVVEFEAAFRDHEGSGTMHERSRFVRRARRWVYVDGEVTYS